jgi:hypothetical protein
MRADQTFEAKWSGNNAVPVDRLTSANAIIEGAIDENFPPNDDCLCTFVRYIGDGW